MLSGAGLALQAGPLTGPLNSAVIPMHQASRCGDIGWGHPDQSAFDVEMRAEKNAQRE
jgi:hypothetical protein